MCELRMEKRLRFTDQVKLGLDDLEIEDVVRTDSLSSVLMKFLDVHCDGQSLQFLCAQLQPATVVAPANRVGVVVI